MRYLLIALAIVSASCMTHSSGVGNPPIPPATGVTTEDKSQLAALSYVDRARAAFPEAKRRFLEGLPEGYELRVTADLKDSVGRRMNNLIVVDKIEDGLVTGHWWEGMARGVYDAKDIYTFSERDIIDWAIKRPNGVIEGNFGWWPLASLFVFEQRGTGKTCDLAKREASSASRIEAKKSCDALSAQVCRSEMAWWLPRSCEWNKNSQLYEVMGLRNYGCCV